jgi:voltage-gated potassium channel Kch
MASLVARLSVRREAATIVQVRQAEGKPREQAAPPPQVDEEPLAATTVGLASTATLVRHLEHVHRGEIELHSRPGAWWRNWGWALGTVVLLGSYGLVVGYGGDDNSIPHRLVNGLSLLGFTSSGAPSKPAWPYILGVDLAHLVIAFAGLTVLAALFSNRFVELRARLRRGGHAVVCGVGDTGLRSVRGLKAAGYRITALDPDPNAETTVDAREAGALVLRRNATHVPALETAGVSRAAVVVCAGPDDATNTRIASLVVAMALATSRRGSTPSIHVHVDEEELAQTLRGPLASVGAARLHFFNVASVWARAILAADGGPLAAFDQDAPRIVVFGSTSLACSVVIGAAKQWHDHVRANAVTARMAISVVSPSAADVCGSIASRYVALQRVCDLSPIVHAPSAGAPFGPVTATANGGSPVSTSFSAVYACLDDASANLALAIEIERQLGEQTPVYLPANAAAAALGPLLLGVGRIRPVVLPDDAEVLHDQMREQLAHLLHETYLTDRRKAADFGSRPADREWSELREDERRSNRANVDDMIAQLRATWYEIEPRYDWDEPLEQLPDAATETMAQLEHLRWFQERRKAGYKHGPRRDTRRWHKRHELLVPWPELPDDAKETTRALVRDRPRLLARAGFKLTRDPARELLARRLHERYVEAQSTQGASSPFATDWENLPPDARAANLAAVDSIALQLARIGCRAAPAVVRTTRPRAFTSEQIEQMARFEHERWMDERKSAGWRLGERDNAKRTHPSLVPWDALPESEREKDRDVVRAIPDLLASIGYTIVG